MIVTIAAIHVQSLYAVQSQYAAQNQYAAQSRFAALSQYAHHHVTHAATRIIRGRIL